MSVMKSLSILCVSCALALGATVTVPGSWTTSPGTSEPLPILTNSTLRDQELIGPEQFGSGTALLITKIAFRAFQGIQASHIDRLQNLPLVMAAQAEVHARLKRIELEKLTPRKYRLSMGPRGRHRAAGLVRLQPVSTGGPESDLKFLPGVNLGSVCSARCRTKRPCIIDAKAFKHSFELT